MMTVGQLPTTSKNKRMERCWDGGKDADMWMINTICNTFVIIWFDDDCVIVLSFCHDIDVVHFPPHQDQFDQLSIITMVQLESCRFLMMTVASSYQEHQATNGWMEGFGYMNVKHNACDKDITVTCILVG